MGYKYRLFAVDKALEERIFYLLNAGVAFTIPFKSSWNSGLCIALLVFWIVFLEKNFEVKSIKFKLFLLLSSLFIITIIGLIYSENIKDGMVRVQQKAILFIFPLVFGTIQTDFKKLSAIIINSFITGLFIVCFFTLIHSIYVFIEYKTTEQFFGHDLAEGINLYPYIFSLYCLLAVLFLLESLRSKDKMFKHKHFVIAAIFLFTAFILLLSVKQILISWLVVCLVYSFLLAKSKWQMTASYVTVLIILIISVASIPTLKHKAIEVISSNSETIVLDEDSSLGKSWNGIQLRKAIWTCSLGVIEKNIWMGVGSGDGQDELQAAYESRKFYFASRYNRFNVHNEYLQILVNFGVIGFSMVLITIFVPLYLLRSQVIYVMFTFCILSIFLTESMLEVNKGVIIYAVFNSLFIFWKVEEKGKSTQAQNKIS